MKSKSNLTKIRRSIRFQDITGDKELATSSRMERPKQTKSNRKGRVSRRKPRKESYAIYIYKLLKTIHPDLGISKKSMDIMNTFCTDMFTRLAVCSGELVKYSRKTNMNQGDIIAATDLILTGDLRTHAKNDASRALHLYFFDERSIIVEQMYT